MRATDRGRLFFPFFLSLALFPLYLFFDSHRRLLLARNLDAGKVVDWLFFAAAVPAIFLIVRLLDLLVFDFAIRRQRKVDAPQLLRQVLAITLYLILFATAISSIFHHSVTTFLTTTTVLAAVLGLALQETLGNLFAGIAIHMEGGFEIGDVIHSGDYLGVVEGMSWRATRIRAVGNQIVVLPNSLLARERLEIFPRNNFNGRVLQIGVDQNIPPATVIPILVNAASHVDGVAREMPCIARIGAFTDSGVTYELKYYTSDYSTRERIDAEIRRAVWYALRRNQIAFATAITSVQSYKPPTVESAELPREELIARLQAVDILSPLSAGAHETLADAVRMHVYAKGETILRHGAAGDSMFIVHHGTTSVRVSDDHPPGWREVAALGEGSVFGEMALLTGEARTADVVAVTDVTALEIRKDALQPILVDHPDLAAAISGKIALRRDGLTLAPSAADEESRTVLSRIRDWFGL